MAKKYRPTPWWKTPLVFCLETDVPYKTLCLGWIVIAWSTEPHFRLEGVFFGWQD